MTLQRGLGNRATRRLLQKAPDFTLTPDQRSPRLLQRDAQPSPMPTGDRAQKSVEPDRPAAGGEIRQGPIGDLVVPLPDLVVVPMRSINKSREFKFDETTLLTVPIPELAVMARIHGSAKAGAAFDGSLGPGLLRNIRIGLSYRQAATMALLPGMPMFAGAGLSFLMGTMDDVRGLADLEMPAQISLRLGIEGILGAAASTGLFDIARLDAGLQALASASTSVSFRGPVGLYHEKGHTRFRFNQSLDIQLALAFQLRAFIDAMLLGFRWNKSWTLANHPLKSKWAMGTPLSVDYDNGAVLNFGLGDGELSLSSIVQQLLGATPGLHSLQPVANPHATPGAGGAGSSTGGGGAPGGPPGPRGRTAEDPIPMRWFKSPGLYPTQFALNGTQFFLTEPSPLRVPDGGGFADIRRHADSAGNITIGVNPGSRFYPAVGRVWPRVASGVVRTGTVQAQFRRLLSAHGYDWNSKEADHVRDLQWRGEDSYANLWPLERSHNNAANRILQQPVTYVDDAGNTVTVALMQTPLNRWFRIDGYA